MQALLASPSITPFVNKAKAFAKQLRQARALLDVWLTVQRGWLMLSPLLSSRRRQQDIARKFPTEVRQWLRINQAWHDAMQRTSDAPGVMQVVGGNLLGVMTGLAADVGAVKTGLAALLPPA